LAEWLYEAGIGENRAILVEDGAITEAAVELPDALRVGAVVPGRLGAILVPGVRGLVSTAAGDALVEPLPGRLTEGESVRVEILREAIPEQGRPKLARARVTDAPAQAGPDLRARIGHFRDAPHSGPGLFEQAGWSELLEEAASGDIAFPGGRLRMSLTPAMTLFDVDGALPAPALAAAGAQAAARAIRRFGVGGSIGIDLPTLASKADRQAAAAALDAALPQPFERTAVNGFGFLQVVRKRERPSLPELLQGDPVGAQARALLRRAERSLGSGERTLHAAPSVVERIGERQDWVRELERRIGAPVRLQAEPGLAISAAYVHSQHP
jgi:hypothetical protein